jgi:hypothetical protein
MEIFVEDVYFLDPALKEPARRLTRAADFARSPILQELACVNSQARALAAFPPDHCENSVFLFPTETNNSNNAE